MKKVLPISNNKFPQKAFAVLVIVALISFLLTLKPVAEKVKNLVEMLGITFPPLDVFQNTAQNIFETSVGFILVGISVVALVLSVKIGLIVSGLALATYGIYRIYKTFAKGQTEDRLPKGFVMPDKK